MQVSDNMRWKSGYQENSESQRLPQIRIIINGHPSCQANLTNAAKIRTERTAAGIPMNIASNILSINKIITLKKIKR